MFPALVSADPAIRQATIELLNPSRTGHSGQRRRTVGTAETSHSDRPHPLHGNRRFSRGMGAAPMPYSAFACLAGSGLGYLVDDRSSGGLPRRSNLPVAAAFFWPDSQ